MDRFGLTGKVSKTLVQKNFEVGHFSRSAPSEFWLNGSRPQSPLSFNAGPSHDQTLPSPCNTGTDGSAVVLWNKQHGGLDLPTSKLHYDHSF